MESRHSKSCMGICLLYNFGLYEKATKCLDISFIYPIFAALKNNYHMANVTYSEDGKTLLKYEGSAALLWH